MSTSVCQLPVIEGEGDLLCQGVRVVLRKMTYVHSTSVPAASPPDEEMLRGKMDGGVTEQSSHSLRLWMWR